jgi:SAM-dependent methyltransferase
MTRLYDDPAFFAAYAGLPRSRQGLEGAAEWPAMRSLLPPLGGARVVDLGCGYGWFCRWARAQGAESVLGLDLSARMLDRAREMTADPAIRYAEADLAAPGLPEAAFDLAYSSLALHYRPEVAGALAAVHRALRPGGRLVASVEHPISMAPRRPGFVRDAEGRPVWPLDADLEEGERRTDRLAPGVIKHHRTVAFWVNALLAAGFALERLEDWGPSPAQVAARPDWAPEREQPMFLLLAARKPG